MRGRLTENAPLAGITWFRVGGPAEVMFRPADIDDLAAFLKATPADVPVTVIGVGSNLLVRDGGVAASSSASAAASPRSRATARLLRAGAAALDLNVAMTARDAGLGRARIPVRHSRHDRRRPAHERRRLWPRDQGRDARRRGARPRGQRQYLTNRALGFGYRHCGAPEDWIFVAAELKGEPDDAAAIQRRMDDDPEARAPKASRCARAPAARPSPTRSDPRAGGRKAWELIDAAGCRGLTRGGAMVSEKHCNFLINTGTATAADLEGLGEEVRARVTRASSA